MWVTASLGILSRNEKVFTHHGSFASFRIRCARFQLIQSLVPGDSLEKRHSRLQIEIVYEALGSRDPLSNIGGGSRKHATNSKNASAPIRVGDAQKRKPCVNAWI